MNRLKVNSLGPIKEADITFGDLTIMVGPQASGKSILLQLLKLLADKPTIRSIIEQYGFTWGKSTGPILDRYFGEGMSTIWSSETKVELNDKEFASNFVLPKEGEKHNLNREQSLFYIPAHRILCFQNGWPRFFTDYDDSIPFVLRDFSESIRLYVEEQMNTRLNFIYSFNTGLNKQIKETFDQTIFSQAQLDLDMTGRKRFKLEVNKSNISIPYTVWSSGQKEFMPLLLSFYYLCPLNKQKVTIIKTVILEEPEMGLHPQAIKSVLLQILDLMQRGYEVILSTHSPLLLEFAWALNNLQKNDSSYFELAELFELNNITDDLKKILEHALGSAIKTYFFDRQEDGVVVRDISSLDAGSEDEAIAEWGGLTSFSTKAVDIVSNAVSHE